MTGAPPWVQWLLWAGGIAALLGALAKGIRWVFRVLRRLNTFLDEWLGTGAGDARRPGVVERLAGNERAILDVRHDIANLQRDVGSLRSEITGRPNNEG